MYNTQIIYIFRAAIDYPFGSMNGINKKCAAVLEGIQVLEMKVGKSIWQGKMFGISDNGI